MSGAGMEVLGLGAAGDRVEARLARWQEEGFGPRLWRKDPTLWSPEPVPELADRLGWLDLPGSMAAELPALERCGGEAAAEGVRHAVVLGMGGSSLAPEVFQRTFGNRPGYPELLVLDSTHPDAVLALAARIDPARSLFVVSSKSGTTTETLSFFRFFWQRVAALGPDLLGHDPGRRFLAVTDPGTPLEELARSRGFRAVFSAPSDVGGRYSALTPFGLLPAALIGADLPALLGRARAMAETCAGAVPAAENPGLRLGAILGELALLGRDKLTLATSPGLAAFPDWLEQLVAESTGKDGRGIVPVAGEPLGPPEAYGGDRLFAALLLEAERAGLVEPLAALARAGHPAVAAGLGDPLDLGGEIFRWEVAVAAAAAVLGIHPFDQPDVQLAKELAGRAMKEGAASGEGEGAVATDDPAALAAALASWREGLGPGHYLGIHAYLAPTAETSAALARIQERLRDETRLATTFGYGPRFLHSTGQLHKGGPATGRFLQLLDRPRREVPVPETDYTFAALIRAQAAGDRRALEQRGRRVLAVDLGGDPAAGLARLERALAG